MIYYFQMQGKTQADIVHLCLSLIFSITNHTIKLRDQPFQDSDTAVAEKSSNLELKDLLCQVPKFNEVIVQELAVTLLTHPMFLYWYQCKEVRSMPCSVDNPDAISAIITGFVMKLISALQTQLSTDKIQKFVSLYATMTFTDIKRVVDAYSRMIGQEDDNTDQKRKDKPKSDARDESDDDDDDSDASIDTNSSSGRNTIQEKAIDVSTFTYLANFVTKSTISDVVCQYLKQPKELLPDGRTDFFTRVICELACSSHEADPRIGYLLAGLLQSTECEEFGRALHRILMHRSQKEVFFITKEMLLQFLNSPTEVGFRNTNFAFKSGHKIC